MNILLVSQCNKNALKETRRILDQFAERRGGRTWQTPITWAGLETLRKMLRKSARKNTAVACHWIRGHNHSELLWIVGDASQFNFHGAIPTNTTTNDILRGTDENDWHTLTDIHLLATLAALFHDFGKACKAFQDKLEGKNKERNRYRHEWISLRLLQAFVGDDDDAGWLRRLQQAETIDEDSWLKTLQRDGLDKSEPLPLSQLPPIAETVGWLIISHHRLPVLPSMKDGEQIRIGRKSNNYNANSIPALPDGIEPAWNEIDAPDEPAVIKPYWQFLHGLPSRSHAWCKRAARVARQSLERQSTLSGVDLHNHYALHIARLCLMLADHYYSSLSEQAPNHATIGDPEYPLFANTTRDRYLAQRLDDHLLGVTREVGKIAHRLPDTLAALPRIARHKGFRRRSKQARFRWQDKAFDLSAALRERSQQRGFFGVNMASTGCGKTLANGRICYALADPEHGTRFTVALGLRTLTLQTGSAYRRDLSLSSDDLAVRVGGQASRLLYEQRESEEESQLESRGKSSAEPLFDTDSYVHFDGQIDEHPLLSRVVASPHARSLITAPILVCTIDHLMPATESLRGGGQIAPMLRLMGADLILDEPDDFGQHDMPALCRLVYWTGLLGSRVILSSATLPPAMVEGLFRAYRAGRAEYQKNRGEPGQPLNICCAWFDENGCQHHDCDDSAGFRAHHGAFSKRRAAALVKAMPRRRARIAEPQFSLNKRDELPPQFAEQLLGHAQQLHAHHNDTDPQTGHRVSFGLIRMANIGPLFDVAQALYALDAPPDVRIHLCVYHAAFPLLLRSAIENRLDAALDRHEPDAVFKLADIRNHLDSATEPNQIFIVLGSPVTEVGRDHDYDWAVVEPSSMRSIIQLAGRVRRHRVAEAEHDNIILLKKNWRALDNTRGPAFRRPGFEGGDYELTSHALSDLLTEDEYRIIDARPRLQVRNPLDATRSLVDLEHACMADALIAPEAPAESAQPTRGHRRRRSSSQQKPRLAAHSAYSRPELWLTGILAQQWPFREQTTPQIDLVLLPDEDETDYQLVRSDPQKYGPPLEMPVEDRLLRRVEDECLNAERITPWANADYMTELANRADARSMDLAQCARVFGVLQMDQSDDGWRWHPLLGFKRI